MEINFSLRDVGNIRSFDKMCLKSLLHVNYIKCMKCNHFPETFSEIFFLDIYFCPFLKNPKKSLENVSILTIIQLYRLVAKIINLIL